MTTAHSTNDPRPWGRWLAAGAIAVSAASAGAIGLDQFPQRLLQEMSSRFGPGALAGLEEWRLVLRDPERRTPRGEIERVSGFFNRVPFAEDLQHWGLDDYWATPVEMLASRGGDCEDYAISKYLTLKQRGVPIAKMRITYVYHGPRHAAHMVLAYYPTPDGEPLIVDNLRAEVLPASLRPDLVPVYSFNDDDLWVEQRGGKGVRPAGQVRKWDEFQARLARQYAP